MELQSSVLIENNTFSDNQCPYTSCIRLLSQSPTIRFNEFNNIYGSPGLFSIFNSDVNAMVNYNFFSDTTLDSSQYIVEAETGSGTANFTYNYWGTDDGKFFFNLSQFIAFFD